MTTYQQLASELKSALSACRPIAAQPAAKRPYVRRKVFIPKLRRSVYPSQTPEANRRRYEKMLREKSLPGWRKKYGRKQIKLLFPAIAEIMGITETAARGRFYRKDLRPPTIPKEVLTLARRKIKTMR